MKQDAWCPIEQAQVVKLNKEISDITPIRGLHFNSFV